MSDHEAKVRAWVEYHPEGAICRVYDCDWGCTCGQAERVAAFEALVEQRDEELRRARAVLDSGVETEGGWFVDRDALVALRAAVSSGGPEQTPR